MRGSSPRKFIGRIWKNLYDPRELWAQPSLHARNLSWPAPDQGVDVAFPGGAISEEVSSPVKTAPFRTAAAPNDPRGIEGRTQVLLDSGGEFPFGRPFLAHRRRAQAGTPDPPPQQIDKCSRGFRRAAGYQQPFFSPTFSSSVRCRTPFHFRPLHAPRTAWSLAASAPAGNSELYGLYAAVGAAPEWRKSDPLPRRKSQPPSTLGASPG